MALQFSLYKEGNAKSLWVRNEWPHPRLSWVIVLTLNSFLIYSVMNSCMYVIHCGHIYPFIFSFSFLLRYPSISSQQVRTPAMSFGFVWYLLCDHSLVKPVVWTWSYWGQWLLLLHLFCHWLLWARWNHMKPSSSMTVFLVPVSCTPYAVNHSYCGMWAPWSYQVQKTEFWSLLPHCLFFVCLTFSHPTFYSVLWAFQGIIWGQAHHSASTCY